MASPYPKPDGERVRRNKPSFEWVELPASHSVAAPPLPDSRQWHPETVAWWNELWLKPQAVMWDKSGSSLWVLAHLYDDLFRGADESKSLSSEIRQLEDRHGLNPKAMLQLRWRYSEDEPEDGPRRAKPRTSDRKARVLKIVEGDK